MSDVAALRADMVDRQIAARGIDDPRLIEAFAAVPREMFVAPELGSRAYDDGPLPIGQGQTISQPYIVALMIAAAEVGPDDRVLEVGAGSGYAAAVIGQIAKEVIAVERHPGLVRIAAGRMRQLAYGNVRIVEGDGTQGWPAAAPYDAILAAASGSRVPDALIEQLKPGGRLVLPLGGQWGAQDLIKLTKREDGSTALEHLAFVQFVPLIES